MSEIRVRFAPSPTGYLHIGGARTALFNWLFARHHGGAFILRIEDTDRERSTTESIQAILDGMTWLGLDWDEGPVFQSERAAAHKAAMKTLVEQGKAYYCDCPPELLEAKRQAALAQGLPVRYDGLCREAGKGPGPGTVVRLCCPRAGETTVEDLIRGPVTFRHEQLGDLVIWRSDDTPVYNFAVVVDDADMRISHVIRGDDHLNNTPRQVLIYEALGLPVPQFAHVPMIMGADGGRLSKRHGAVSVTAYRDLGYLPEALVNYLVRLSWAFGDQEVFSRDEMIRLFELGKVGKAAAVFNPDKLLWLNFHYLKTGDERRICELLGPFLAQLGLSVPVDDRLAGAFRTLKERHQTLPELARAAAFYFQEEIEIDEPAAKKHLTVKIQQPLAELADRLQQAEFTEPALEQLFMHFVQEKGLKLGQLAQPVRVAVVGRAAGPGLFETLAVLGREKTVARLRRAVKWIGQQGGKEADGGPH